MKSGKIRFSSVRLTKQGGSVGGTVVAANDPTYPLAGATVTLYDAAGNAVAGTTSGSGGAFVLVGPLRTQKGMTVVAAPKDPAAPYLGAEPYRCMYGKVTLSAVSVTTGRRTTVAPLALPHLAGAQSPSCSSTASPAATTERSLR